MSIENADPVIDADRVWVVLPTYNEAENLESMAGAILTHVPRATLLVVDDGSPDGTGQIADRLSSEDGRVQVLHRTAKEGLGKAHRAIAPSTCVPGKPPAAVAGLGS